MTVTVSVPVSVSRYLCPCLCLCWQAKVWNAASMTCVRSLSCGFALCVAFGPGNRHAIVGTKTGAIQLFDLASGDMIEELAEAHEVCCLGD
jgi:hypothetical protein